MTKHKNYIMKKKTTTVTQPSGKSWLQKVKQVANVVGHTANIILTAPLKLPIKIAAAVKYLAILAGLIQAVELEQKTDA